MKTTDPIAVAWMRQALVEGLHAEHLTWMGVPVQQIPTDMLVMQELIYKVRPDLLIECGVNRGGSLLFYAGIFAALGHGRVIGIDNVVLPETRELLKAWPHLPMSVFEGDSAAPEKAVLDAARAADIVMVCLDSDHSTEHVYREMLTYRDVVTPGSYLCVFDGAAGINGSTDHPLAAIERYLSKYDDYEVDEYCTRFGITCNPKGYLRKKTPGRISL